MLGAQLLGGDRVGFSVWAPTAKKVVLRLSSSGGESDIKMARTRDRVFHAEASAKAGDRYSYIVDGSKPLPDPVSRYLPEGVHGRTEILDSHAFAWTDQNWRGIPYSEYVIYELHVGTFTAEGTFDGVVSKLPYLKEMGVTVIELMPVAAFPGRWNWGYDGVSPYAVFAGYGGPEGLQRLVNAAHAQGLAVILDVVYNHLGAEGNYLSQFGPYFTHHHATPWGDAVNFDDENSRPVRDYFVENALYWIREYHIDGLRLDAVQQIKDDSREHIVAEIARTVKQFGAQHGRVISVIAEDDRNIGKILAPVEQGGWGIDGVWSDDFHHSLYRLLTGENRGYYQDFGRLEQLARALNEGFVFQGEHFEFWGAPRGTSSSGIPLFAHVICIENHDQVGNRAWGERLTELTPVQARKLAAAVLLLAPHTPLIFMGQEHDQRNRFQFFTDYGDPVLRQAVRKGRREEFRQFGFEDIPDPQDPATFESSKLEWQLDSGQLAMYQWYKWLLVLRKAFITNSQRTSSAEARQSVLEAVFGDTKAPVKLRVMFPASSFDGMGIHETDFAFNLQEPWQCKPNEAA
ncbi:MAG TPA: malto-oligosyltrehalose trehalohydrolase [Terriglobales bacterium]|nr:malto-oligosyltrehalose trehalohydrolase [Terriglobales bacterium]